MKEICAFQTTKNILSSLSLSIDESDSSSRNDYSSTLNTSSIVQERGGLFESDRSCSSARPENKSEFNQSVIVGEQIKFNTCQLPSQSIDQSSEGKLVARVLPKSYAEYDTRKPTPRVDPTPFIESLSCWRARNQSKFVELQDDGSFNNRASHHCQEGFEDCPNDNEESVVILDFYMLRSAHLNQLQGLETAEPEDFAVYEREKHINSLMSSVDVARNHNFGPKSSIPRQEVNNDEVPTKANTSNNIFHLHMNRPSSEEASRTLRRLELSATRKLQSKNPYNGCGKHKKCKDENLANVHKLTSSKIVFEELNPRCDVLGAHGESEGNLFEEMDLSGLSSADLWHIIDGTLCGSTTDRFYPRNAASLHWYVALSIPNMIMPWSNDEEGNGEHSNNLQLADDASNTQSSGYNKSASTSRTSTISSVVVPTSSLSSPPRDSENVIFDIISNPPTILSIDTFENFTTRVFTNVPLVVETKVIYASHAVVTWFAGNEIARHDSNSYTPRDDDVNNQISVLITPMRPGHDGHGCSEAYTFYNSVEPLPRMPIMELREKWIRNGGIRSGVSIRNVVTGSEENKAIRGNRLRVVTYNILADLYAARDIGQHLMYAHCGVDFLIRQRRMPMILAEIISYDADLICLQEVDASIHDGLIRPVLESKGYQGFYSNKVSSQPEGCSMFWSTKSFEPTSETDMRSFPLRSLLTRGIQKFQCEGDEFERLGRISSSQYFDAKSTLQDMLIEFERWESMDGIRQLMEEHDEVRKVYEEEVGQIVQMVRLTPKQGTGKPDKIVVANTHLFYHPMADHIRVMQAYAICHQLDRMRREGNYPDPVLICGDFNSGPLSGAVRLLLHRSVDPRENDCWRYLNEYKWECGDNEYMLDHGFIGNYDPIDQTVDTSCMDERFLDAHEDEESLEESYYSNEVDVDASTDESSNVVPPAIVLPPCFPDLVSGCEQVPKFTNYAVDFIETLDYIFASKPSDREPYGFLPIGEAPMPSDNLVKEYVAMPNECMPSDHVAIVCDFEWTKHNDRKY
mmetsp:Transcript_21824/g.43771  ORF Transcript_21824/g.43771 Transcript_21824/m.43771 type:complete len:1027 (-) Transcript_21824:135-3215(-)